MTEFNWLDSVNETTGRHDMQDWMLAEKLYNCDGFASNYYRDLTAGSKKSAWFFGRKSR